MIRVLTKEQKKLANAKATASLAEQRSRKWIYNDSKQGVLVETEEQFDEIKGIFDLSKPNCANSEIQVIKFGEAKKQVNQAKRDLAAADEKTAKAEAEAKEKAAKEKPKK